jgi:hypothetical protein
VQAYGAFCARVDITNSEFYNVAQHWADRYHRPTRGRFIENSNTEILRDWKEQKTQDED